MSEGGLSLDADMECTEVKAQPPVEGQLESLVILEDGDDPEDFMRISARGKIILRTTQTEDDVEEDGDRLKGHTSTNRAEDAESKQVDSENKEERLADEGSEMKNREEEAVVRMEETLEELKAGPESAIEEEGLKAVSKEEPLADARSAVQLRPKDLLKPDDAHRKMHRLPSDSSDALFELLCALQEGRRLNDQRCSFTLEPRRRCHSVPNALHHGQKVAFSSMTSLQKEEIMDLVAISQARRLDDQRANFKSPVPVVSASAPRRPSSAPAEIPPPRHKSRRSSWKQVMEFGHSAPKPAAKDELYNMILNTQAQGRLEEQRSKAPGPVDDEDFFSLLLKVQGGRMEEQRTELPVALR